jgi:hypothetical protein
MRNINLKRRLKSLILPVVAIGLWAGGFLYFYNSNNYVHQNKYEGEYSFRVGKTKGLFTKRVFIKSTEDGIRETYYEDTLWWSIDYTDKPLDGLVNKILTFGPFSSKPTLDLDRAKDYNDFKPEFDKADKDFARNRNDFVEDMQRYGIN